MKLVVLSFVLGAGLFLGGCSQSGPTDPVDTANRAAYDAALAKTKAAEADLDRLGVAFKVSISDSTVPTYSSGGYTQTRHSVSVQMDSDPKLADKRDGVTVGEMLSAYSAFYKASGELLKTGLASGDEASAYQLKQNLVFQHGMRVFLPILKNVDEGLDSAVGTMGFKLSFTPMGKKWILLPLESTEPNLFENREYVESSLAHYKEFTGYFPLELLVRKSFESDSDGTYTPYTPPSLSYGTSSPPKETFASKHGKYVEPAFADEVKSKIELVETLLQRVTKESDLEAYRSELKALNTAQELQAKRDSVTAAETQLKTIGIVFTAANTVDPDVYLAYRKEHRFESQEYLVNNYLSAFRTAAESLKDVTDNDQENIALKTKLESLKTILAP